MEAGILEFTEWSVHACGGFKTSKEKKVEQEGPESNTCTQMSNHYVCT